MTGRRIAACAWLAAAVLCAAGCASTDSATDSAAAASQPAEGPLGPLARQLNKLTESRGAKFRRAMANLVSASPDQRRAALLYLENWEWASPEAREAFAAILVNRLSGDRDNLVRIECARALAAYPSPDGAKALMTALADADEGVRVEAATSLSGTEDPEGRARLVHVLQADSAARVRAAAARSLGECRPTPPAPPDPRIIAGLLDGLDDPDFAVVRRSADSLSALTGKDLGYERKAWEEGLRSPTTQR